MIRLAVLDMAGTTVRDDGIVERCFEEALGDMGITVADARWPTFLDVVHETMGRRKIDVFRGLFGDEEEAQRGNAAFETAIMARIGRGEIEALPGAVDAIAELRARDVKVCLTTGFSGETQQALVDHLGWSDLVDLTLSPGGASGRGRPYPDLVLNAVLRMRIDDVRAVAVAGDTANDLLSGWRAGASIVAGVLTGAHSSAELAEAPHTHILPSVADLPAVVFQAG